MRNRLEMIARLQEAEAKGLMTFATTECFACGDLCYLHECRFGQVKARDNQAVSAKVFMHPRCWEDYWAERIYFLAEDIMPPKVFKPTKGIKHEPTPILEAKERMVLAKRKYDVALNHAKELGMVWRTERSKLRKLREVNKHTKH